MGFSEWFTGTKCAECGRKIAGARFDRTVMGTKVWVCSACNEKLSEERRLDTESNIAGAAERGQESATAEQKDFAEVAAAIQQRSDADIAEAMSTIFLGKYAAFTKSVHDSAGGAGLNHEAAFMYFLAVSSSAVRRLLRLQLDSARLDRIEETAGRYALAGFIHGMCRNTTEVDGTEPIRQKMLSTLVERYRKLAGVHQRNAEHLLKQGGEKNEEMVYAYVLRLCLEWFGKNFAEASVESKTRMAQCAGNAFIQAMSVAIFLQPQLATLASHVNRDIEFQLPESWILREERPSTIVGESTFRYYDPSTPQYVLLVSTGAPVSMSETPEASLRRILPTVVPEAVPVSLGPERAIAHYRTRTPENGQAKDDHHWLLGESKGGGSTRHAFFTLSVLEARADVCTTEALAQSLGERIQQARFLG